MMSALPPRAGIHLCGSDIAAAKRIQDIIAENFSKYGIKEARVSRLNGIVFCKRE
jgi:tRNA G10  N-methylase Trm11